MRSPPVPLDETPPHVVARAWQASEGASEGRGGSSRLQLAFSVVKAPCVLENIRAPATHWRWLVSGILAWSAFWGMVETALWTAAPCPFLEIPTALGCAQVRKTTQGMELVRYLGGYGASFVYFLCKLWAVGRLQWLSRRGQVELLMTPDHWSAASSRDVFMDTAGSLMGAFAQFGLVATFSTVTVSALMLHANLSSAALWHFADTLCGAKLSLCRAGVMSTGVMPNLNMGILLWVCSVFFFMPFGFWSRVSREAMVETQQHTLRRLLNLHWFVLPCFPFNLALLLIQIFRLQTFTATRAEAEGFFIGQLCMMAYSLVTIALHIETIRPQRLSRHVLPEWMMQNVSAGSGTFSFSHLMAGRMTWTGPHGLQQSRVEEDVATNFSILNVERGSNEGMERLREDDSAEEDRDLGPQRSGWARVWRTLNGGDAGVRFQAQVYLLILAFMMNQQFMTLSIAYLVVLWVIRLMLFILAVCIKDVPCTFDEMRGGREGMGLLADAPWLCQAMQAYVDGREFNSSIPLVKASLLRMQETIAVSYRWQEETAYVGGLQINMSPWQMRTIISAVKKSNCRYLWIDCIAVEQSQTELQRAVLSRMMAVYAACMSTIVLRSLEHDQARYHQRAWTLQEFCAARHLRVVDQPPDPDGHITGTMSVQGGEDEAALRLRRRVLGKIHHVVPLWLLANTNGSFMNAIQGRAAVVWSEYSKLSRKLDCADPADKIRALLPILSMTPVETEDEMVQLVECIAQAVGVPEPAEIVDVNNRLSAWAKQLERYRK
eukprot:jgi/Tetstr1/449381/TSEL_003890.t1